MHVGLPMRVSQDTSPGNPSCGPPKKSTSNPSYCLWSFQNTDLDSEKPHVGVPPRNNVWYRLATTMCFHSKRKGPCRTTSNITKVKPKLYLKGQGDLVSRLRTPMTHIVTPLIPIINLLTKSP